MKNRITIGISSIVLIFMILCLAVFSLLSLSDAKSALTYAQKHADTVQMYYEADAIAQKFIQHYRDTYPSSEAFPELPEGTILRNGGSGDSITSICEIPMASGQTLYVEFSKDGSEILAYYVYNNTDYVIDSDLPVWDGN